MSEGHIEALILINEVRYGITTQVENRIKMTIVNFMEWGVAEGEDRGDLSPPTFYIISLSYI